RWSYEYVDCGNWENAKDMLEAGEIDLLAPAQQVDTLRERFDFASISMGVEATAIFTNADRDDLLYEDFGAMKGLTYGVPQGVVFETEFVNDYSVKHGLEPSVKRYANTTTLLEALHNREIDAAVTNIMFSSDEVKLLGWFSPVPIYFIVRKGNQTLLDQINLALTQIMIEEPDFMAQLESRYFPIFNNTQFTYEEQQLIERLPELTVGCEVNHPPLSALNEQTGEVTGITRDILDEISRISGLRFHYEALPATGVTFRYLADHKIYLISNAEYNDVNKGVAQMRLSTPYLDTAKVMVASSQMQFDSSTHLRVALATGSGTLAQAISTEYPNFEYAAFATVEECFDAIKNGQADATIQNRYVADTALENPRYSDLTVIPIQLLDDELCMAALAADDSELCAQLSSDLFLSILDKSIARISNETINGILIENTSNMHYQYTLMDFLGQYAPSLIAIGLLLALSAALLIYAQRTTALKNRQLAGKNEELGRAVNAANHANAAKSQFLSRMSHEIRTPMNAIVGLTAIAKRHEQEPERMDEYLTKIDASSRVLLNIINDVLDMSAIESDKLKIAHEEFDLKQVLSGITTIYYAQCRSKGIEYSMVTDLHDETVIGDSLRVNQILLNLVSNAYKFTPAGGKISIEVVQQETREQTAFIRFKVSDTGCGMSEDMLARLFKPFEQEDAGTARKHGGSGLGLSIAKNLVSMMSGAISVESQQGKGTTFTVDLPFEISGHTVHVTPERLGHLQALIVDDDQNARLYTSVILERIGIRYDMAASGEEALRRIEERGRSGGSYDICFVDWKMPGLNGVELTRRIRQASQTSDHKTAVIIVSAYDLSEVEDEAKEAGANLFISKPLFQSTVFNALMQVTGGVIKETQKEQDSYDFSGHRALLAEDNETNTEIAMDLMEIVNLGCDHAANGREAVDMFTASKPGTYDMIFMDIQMPEMDGYEAARAIRASSHPEAAAIPIYAMTANAFTEDVAAALSAGMNGHIAKPIDTKTFYATIAK
ncbi:MAG: response regulator, partial [Eubacteriales bacterium]|nr:response regulator [Eubacteriales bacterium]